MIRSIGAALALVFLLLALAESADAATSTDLIARHEKDWVRITDKPCQNEKVLRHVPADTHERFMSASVQVDGKLYRACWTGLPQGVMLVYEDSDRGMLPYMAFEPVKDV